MKRNIIVSIMMISILIGCSNNKLIYKSPINTQISDYIRNNDLTILDSIWIQDSAILLLDNTLITLSTDQHGKIYEHKIYWSANNIEPVLIGNGNPYVGIIINDELINNGASQIIVEYRDGRTYSRGITGQKGYLISSSENREMDNLIILDTEGQELYNKRE